MNSSEAHLADAHRHHGHRTQGQHLQQPALANEDDDPLTVCNRLAYGCGDLSSNLTWGLMLSFLMFYYTDIYIIPAATVAWLLLLPRVFDSFCDPLVGYFIDRTGGRHVRSMVGALALPFGVSAFLCFLPLPLSPTGKIIWASVSYLVLGAVFSFINTPYGVLGIMMATHPQERVSLNAYRFAGCQLGQLIVAAATLPAILLFGGGSGVEERKTGVMILVGIIAFASSLLWLVTWRGCRARQPFPPGGSSLRTLTKALLSNRSLHLANSLSFLHFLVFCSQSAVTIHYTRLILQKSAGSASFLLTGTTIAAFLGATGVPVLSRRLGVRRAFLALMAAEAFCLGMIWVSGSNFWLVGASMMGQYLAVGGVSPLCYAILAEAIDEKRRQTGITAAGLAFSINSLVSKIAAGLAGFIVATFLAWGHYQPLLTQADRSLASLLKLGFIGIPGAAVTVSFFLVLRSDRDAY